MDADEREMLVASVHQLLTGTRPDPLGDLGWDELFAAEPAVAVTTVFEEKGRTLATIDSLDRVVASAVGVAGDVTIVHPVPGDHRSPGPAGVVLAGGRRPSSTTAWLSSGGPVRLIAEEAVAWYPCQGIDADLLGWQVTVDEPVEAGVPPNPTTGPAAIVAARRALAHELVGVAEATQNLALRHVLERTQFGHPLAALQSVRHRLADVHVAIEAARTATAVAWAEPDDLAATVAKALAGRAARAATAAGQQLCGAIGFTWDHPLHRYVRRALALDGLYGASDELAGEIGALLAERGHAPRLGR